MTLRVYITALKFKKFKKWSWLYPSSQWSMNSAIGFHSYFLFRTPPPHTQAIISKRVKGRIEILQSLVSKIKGTGSWDIIQIVWQKYVYLSDFSYSFSMLDKKVKTYMTSLIYWTCSIFVLKFWWDFSGCIGCVSERAVHIFLKKKPEHTGYSIWIIGLKKICIHTTVIQSWLSSLNLYIFFSSIENWI